MKSSAQGFITGILFNLAVKLIEKYKPEAKKEALEYADKVKDQAFKYADEKIDEFKTEAKQILDGKIKDMMGGVAATMATLGPQLIRNSTEPIKEIIPGTVDDNLIDGLNNVIDDIFRNIFPK